MHSPLGVRPARLAPVTPRFRPARSAFRRVLDEQMFVGSTEQFVDLIERWSAGSRFRFAVGVNAHVVNLAAQDADFAARLAEADALYADGQSVVWGAQTVGLPIPERIATTDLAPLVVERLAGLDRRIYLLGGDEGVAEEAARALRTRFPRARIRTHHGQLDPTASAEVLRELEEWGPDLLFVGLGDPLQVEWITDNRAALGDLTVLTCGGLFDWLSGRHPRAPRWMIRCGLEWLWRLRLEPARLSRRYLIGNPVFVLRVLRASLERRPVAALQVPAAHRVHATGRPGPRSRVSSGERR